MGPGEEDMPTATATTTTEPGGSTNGNKEEDKVEDITMNNKKVEERMTSASVKKESAIVDVEKNAENEPASSESVPVGGWSPKKKMCCALFCLIVLGLAICIIVVAVIDPSTLTVQDYLDVLDNDLDFKISENSTDEELRQAMDALNEYYLENSKCEAGSVMGISRSTNNDVGTNRIFAARGSQKVMTGKEEEAVDENTLFEIGSISKPVTGLVLAHHIVSGLIGASGVDTPLNDLLPDGIPDLVVQDKLVTLRNLVTHTSGFPRVPKIISDQNLNSKYFTTKNPYAGYTEEDMLEQITIAAEEGLSQTGDIEYSNFGLSILAYLLGRNVDQPYQNVQQSLTYGIMNLTSTYVGATIPDADMPRLSTGYGGNSRDQEMPYWYDGGLFIDGAGSTVSSASDLLSLAEMLMAASASDSSQMNSSDTMAMFHINETDHLSEEDRELLKQAIELSLTPLRDSTTTITGVAFAWFFGNQNHDDEKIANDKLIYGHSGGTAGFRSHLVFQPAGQFGVVALSNCAFSDDVVAMGEALASKLVRRISD